MYFFMGFFGAVACLVMFGAGFVTGWSAYRLTRRRKACKDPRRDIPPQSDAQGDMQAERDAQSDMQAERNAQRDMQAEQDAFRRLQNYSVEDAYGRKLQDEIPAT